jgi:hypothetical protein
LKNNFISQHISLYIEALVPSFDKLLKTSGIKFFGLLSEPGSDFPFHRYHDGHDMLARIVTGDDKSWVQHYQPERKRASTQWKHSASPAKKKFKVIPSSRKVMLTVFGITKAYCSPHSSLKDKL